MDSISKFCNHSKQYEPITAGEYLSERLMEIGLKK